MKRRIDRERISFFLTLGLIGAMVILAGDLMMGWGVRDAAETGMEARLSPYLTVSHGRMFWAAVCGFTGVPLAVVGHYGIYQLLRPCSRKYARLYAAGIFGFLAFGGAGVHVSSVEAAYFYQRMTAAAPETAVEATLHFAASFLLPLYAVLLTGWVIMVYAHIRAVSGGFSPCPRWGWLFSMPVGTLLVSPVGLFGNHEIVNAILVGAFSFGNIWTLAGHLWMLRRIKDI